MMVVCLSMATTGLFANDDIAFVGPLYSLVSKALSEQISALHRFGFYLLLALVGLHVAAVVFYALVPGEFGAADLTGVKISTEKPAREPQPPRLVPFMPALAIALGTVACASCSASLRMPLPSSRPI